MKYKTQKQYRYKGYDYSQDGFYFVTICTKNKELFFGDIKNNKIELSEIGKIAEKYWLEIPNHFSFVNLYEHIIMPNHVHGIIEIDKNKNVGTGQCPVPTRQCPVPTDMDYVSKFGNVKSESISTIIGSYKSIVTKIANKNNIEFAWQSRFHDRIIRNEKEFNNIRNYIVNNVDKWELDKNNKNNLYI